MRKPSSVALVIGAGVVRSLGQSASPTGQFVALQADPRPEGDLD